MEKKNITTIDAYISTFPAATQKLLKQVRQTIKKTAPDATEKIAYGIPTFVYHGNLVHFGGYDHHIGFYPASSGVAHFEKELQHFHTSKGTIQFPLDEPIPLELIARITAFRMKENEEKQAKKKSPAKKTESFFIPRISNPARRALESIGINTPKKLAKYSEKEMLALHGMGKASLPLMRETLLQHGLSFRES
ncbi:Uncharacterized conserved protein YdhG, YjbR/CyaY-like superfamily, DUF1801 family [Chitinophaga jiangningensis]|uniref:Uncharacterized conserved protein YdhG, YjbR/CyaY-like superfamily, DUF1801 family n=1 Tax=Chitinophaga jiangningensis TaxID=1419482 RepID=A0A1M6VPD4_9BACT|nr:DUF1801 domain-containing protein [Chitinophaga jiangningensis]SHK83353.1 Uncharacterized conserved protein YdhG, YjbR/CyaY-like superfamily, DUF1801 family [Chitinophaga jiangningensis]